MLFFLHGLSSSKPNWLLELDPIEAESFEKLGPLIEKKYGDYMRSMNITDIVVLTEPQNRHLGYMTRVELLNDDEV